MTLDELERDAIDALKKGQDMILKRKTGSKLPRGFPRGEFVSEEIRDCTICKIYRYDPKKVLDWINNNLKGWR